MKRILALSTLAIAVAVLAFGRTGRGQVGAELVSFPTQDGGHIYANLYGKGERGVVLAHGGRFNKESWDKQARELVQAGFRVLAIDFRGRGKSRGGAQAKAPKGKSTTSTIVAGASNMASGVASIAGSVAGAVVGMVAGRKSGPASRAKSKSTSKS